MTGDAQAVSAEAGSALGAGSGATIFEAAGGGPDRSGDGRKVHYAQREGGGNGWIERSPPDAGFEECKGRRDLGPPWQNQLTCMWGSSDPGQDGKSAGLSRRCGPRSGVRHWPGWNGQDVPGRRGGGAHAAGRTNTEGDLGATGGGGGERLISAGRPA